jgi:hypothetical protein
VDIDLHRTDIGTAAAKGGGEREGTVFLKVYARRKDGSDRTGNGAFIAETATPSIYRAGIHAGTASDAFE